MLPKLTPYPNLSYFTGNVSPLGKTTVKSSIKCLKSVK